MERMDLGSVAGDGIDTRSVSPQKDKERKRPEIGKNSGDVYDKK